jgi:hypothetical protein
MTDWFRDLWDQDAYANLKFLHEEAVTFAWDLRARRQAQGIVEADRLLKDVRHFFQHVREKNEIIGFVRATRILRHGAMPIRGIDSSAYKDIDLEAAIAWADQVVQNIEHEVDVIERKHILWLTAIAAIAAAIAAVFGFFTLVFDVSKSLIGR